MVALFLDWTRFDRGVQLLGEAGLEKFSGGEFQFGSRRVINVDMLVEIWGDVVAVK